jgi:peptidoglycan hydrolase CwlO-like protein
MYYRRFLALLLCLLLCFSASADYWITEAELTELETILTESQAQLQASQSELTLLQAELKALRMQSGRLQAELIALSEYWQEYASAQKRIKTVLTLALAATSGALIISLYR